MKTKEMFGIEIPAILIAFALLSALVVGLAQADSAILVKGELEKPTIGDTTHARDELIGRNYTDNDIYYLDGNKSLPGVDNVSSKEALKHAIKVWAKNRVGHNHNLTIFISAHGDTDEVTIGGTKVTAADLKSWLDQLKNETNVGQITVVIESCKSGSFIDNLSAPGRKIITASTATQPSYGFADQHGWKFGYSFWTGITNNKTIGAAFKDASDEIKREVGNRQTPLVDDNGDGVGHTAPLPNGGDGNIVNSEYIGVEIPSHDHPPKIQSISPSQVVTIGSYVTIWAIATDDINASAVYAEVISPGWTPPTTLDRVILDLPVIELEDPDGDDKYNTTYHVNKSGDYKFIVYAMDNAGNFGLSLETTVTSVEEVPAITPLSFLLALLSLFGLGAIAMRKMYKR
jgi:hypothetical protein